LLWSRINSFLAPKFDWLQVAVSTYCNASCFYCPRTVYRRQWRNEHLSLKTFRHLAPAFAKTRLIHLQGWGEPFLNPELFAMIQLAKDAGCRVGTTTNGMLLEAGVLHRLVDLEVDILAFSLAGVDEQNDLRRRGASIKKVLEAMGQLNRIKLEKGKTKPEVHVAYMLLRSGIADLAKLPSVLQGLGVSQVVISTLDFVPSGDLTTEALLVSDNREDSGLETQLAALVKSGQAHGLKIHCQFRSGTRTGRVCTENVQRALVVSSTGEVSPCVFTNLPVNGAVTYAVRGQERPYRRLSLGNVREHSLAKIWGQVSYRRFRNSFYEGGPPQICRSCLKL
jgi:MoaA/NifB/PqqE/SkfB family radical SAM enzyme